MLGKAAVPIADVFIKIGIKADTKALTAVIKQLKEATTNAQAFRKATNASFKLKGDARALGTLNTKIDATQKKLKALQKQAAKAIKVRASGLGGAGGRGRGGAGAGGGGMGGFGGARGFGGMVAGMSAFGLMASTVNTAQRLEGARASLIAATGTAEKGGEAFAFLSSEAQRIGVNLLDSSRAFTNLVASGKSVGFSMKQSQELFSATAEAARVLNLSTDDTAGALKAMQQMLSKGTVQSEELKGQLGERLPGAFGMAAKAMGVTTMELGKMLQNGEVLATELLPLLTIELKKFARTDGALEKAMQSNAAEMERMRNSFAEMQDEVAQGGFLEAMTKLFKSAAGAMKALTPAFIVLGKVIKLALSPIIALLNTFTLLNELFGETGVNVGLVAIAFVLALTSVRGAVLALTAAMLTNPLTYILGAIVAALLLVEDFLAGMAGKDSRFFQGLDDQIKQITDDLEPFINALKAVLEFLGLIKKEDKDLTPLEKLVKEERAESALIERKLIDYGEGGAKGATPEDMARRRAIMVAGAEREKEMWRNRWTWVKGLVSSTSESVLTTDAGSKGVANFANQNMRYAMPMGLGGVAGEDIMGSTNIYIAELTTTAENGKELADDLKESSLDLGAGNKQ